MKQIEMSTWKHFVNAFKEREMQEDELNKVRERLDKIHEVELRLSLLEQSQKTLKEELTKISSNLGKLVWLVLSGIILALLNVVVRGGGL